MTEWIERHKIISAVLVVFIIIIVFAMVGTAEQEKPVKKETTKPKTTVACQDVPQVVQDSLLQGLNTPGLTFSKVAAVKAPGFESVYFVSADLQGPGLEGKDDTATFATNKLDPTGTYESVNGTAKEFFVFPDSSKSDAKIESNEAGVKESKDCLAN